MATYALPLLVRAPRDPLFVAVVTVRDAMGDASCVAMSYAALCWLPSLSLSYVARALSPL